MEYALGNEDRKKNYNECNDEQFRFNDSLPQDEMMKNIVLILCFHVFIKKSIINYGKLVK